MGSAGVDNIDALLADPAFMNIFMDLVADMIIDSIVDFNKDNEKICVWNNLATMIKDNISIVDVDDDVDNIGQFSLLPVSYKIDFGATAYTDNTFSVVKEASSIFNTHEPAYIEVTSIADEIDSSYNWALTDCTAYDSSDYSLYFPIFDVS